LIQYEPILNLFGRVDNALVPAGDAQLERGIYFGMYLFLAQYFRIDLF